MQSIRLLTFALLCGASSAAMAQTSVSERPAVPAAGSTAPQSGIEDIVVTATRRDERLQQIPVTVSAVSGASLAKVGISDASQLTQVVPGLVAGGRLLNIYLPTLRGVGSNAGSPGEENPVASYIDGVYQPFQAAAATKLLEIQRVEVLRGPQGTLFGRNASGGLINIITPDPSFTPKFRMRLSGGSFGTAEVSAYGSLGVTDDVALDVAMFAHRDTGYIDDLVRGGKVDGEHTFTVRSKLLWTPSDTSKIVLSGSYLTSDNDQVAALQPLGNGTVGRFFNPNTIIPTHSNQYAGDVDPQVRLKTANLALQTSFDLGGVSLETTSAYQYATAFLQLDSDMSAENLRLIFNSQKATTLQQEVRLLSDNDGPFSWILGAYAFQSKSSYRPLFIQTFRSAVVPFPLSPLTISPTNTTVLPHTKTVSFAGFINGTYAITEALKLTAGLRYTYERRTLDQNLTVRLNATGAVAARQIFDERAKFNNVSPSATLQYVFSPRFNVYATYSTGFKSGTFNAQSGGDPGTCTPTVPCSQAPVRPEKLTDYEVGMKADIGDFLRLNLAAFYYDYRNQQIQVRTNAATTINVNAANSTVKGAEAEATLKISRDFQIRTIASYLDTKFKDFPNGPLYTASPLGGNDLARAGTTNLAGNTLIRAPKFSFSVNPEYSHEFDAGTFGLSFNAYHSSRVFYDVGNQKSQDPYWLVNGQASFAFDNEKYTVSVNLDNVFNASVIQGIGVSQFVDQVAYEPPRRFRVSLGVKF